MPTFFKSIQAKIEKNPAKTGFFLGGGATALWTLGAVGVANPGALPGTALNNIYLSASLLGVGLFLAIGVVGIWKFWKLPELKAGAPSAPARYIVFQDQPTVVRQVLAIPSIEAQRHDFSSATRTAFVLVTLGASCVVGGAVMAASLSSSSQLIGAGILLAVGALMLMIALGAVQTNYDLQQKINAAEERPLLPNSNDNADFGQFLARRSVTSNLSAQQSQQARAMFTAEQFGNRAIAVGQLYWRTQAQPPPPPPPQQIVQQTIHVHMADGPLAREVANTVLNDI